jgi:hypothetical protein
MGRVLPIPEYPAHPPQYEAYANHVKETYERGIKEFEGIQVTPKDKEKQRIAVAAKGTKGMPTQAVAVVKSPPAEHPLKPTLLADIKAATAKVVSARKAAAVSGTVNPNPPPDVAKAKPPPEAPKTNEKPASPCLGLHQQKCVVDTLNLRGRTQKVGKRIKAMMKVPVKVTTTMNVSRS